MAWATSQCGSASLAKRVSTRHTGLFMARTDAEWLAGASGQQRFDGHEQEHREVDPSDVELRGGVVWQRIVGGSVQREVRREIVGIAVARSGGPASACRHVRPTVYGSIEESDRGASFEAVASLVLAMHSVEGPSLPSSTRTFKGLAHRLHSTGAQAPFRMRQYRNVTRHCPGHQREPTPVSLTST